MGYNYERAEQDYWSDPDGAEAELAAYEADLTAIPASTSFTPTQIESDREREEMPVRPTRTAPGRRTAAAAPAVRTTRAKRNPLAEYVNKEATPYHKAFAQWLVKEVGYEPTNKRDFLAAIRLAITTRNLFNQSDFIEEWRERTGETKRGPKPKTTAAPARGKRKPEPEPEEDDFEEDDTEEEDFDSEDAEDFDDTEEASDDEEDADEDDWEDDEEEEEEAPKPAPKPRARTAAKTSSASRQPARAAAPAKKAPAKRPAKPADDDDFVF